MVQKETTLLLRKLRIDRKEFITDYELREYCRHFSQDYQYISRYLMRKGVLTRIFKGIFYVRSIEELEDRNLKYNHLEIVAKGLELKGIRDWYFGLYSALKANNMTHEHFTTEHVVSSRILRILPVTIADHKFQFTKINSRYTSFGVTKRKTRIKSTYIKYSDPEKTILDFIYLWRYEGVSINRIRMNLSDWTQNLDLIRLKRYSKKFPKTVQRTLLEELL